MTQRVEDRSVPIGPFALAAQAGSSATISAKLLAKCISAPDQLVLLVSTPQKRSIELLDDTMRLWRKASDMGYWVRGRGEVRLENGTRIRTVHGGLYGLMGQIADLVVVDETSCGAADVIKAVYPVITSVDGELALWNPGK